jgi:hypothetical protein
MRDAAESVTRSLQADEVDPVGHPARAFVLRRPYVKEWT